MNINTENMKNLIFDIVTSAYDLKNAFTDAKEAEVNYAAVFSQSTEECSALNKAAQGLGEIIQETPTGLLYKIAPLTTVAGNLQLLKIRKPDEARPERGDADFTVTDYDSFKQTYLPKSGFKLIEREGFEMIELSDPNFDVLAYFSNPPLDVQLGIK